MTIRRFTTFVAAGALLAFAAVDEAGLAVSGAPLLPAPLGLVAIIVGCTLLLLAEGHRRFDKCEHRMATMKDVTRLVRDREDAMRSFGDD